jgi:phosphohistidine phosphatase SixA
VDIFLLRTSITEGPDTVPEAMRTLSLTGRQLVRAIGTRIHDKASELDRVVMAPTPASVQTAELFAERVDYLGVLEVMPSLAGAAPPQVISPLILERGSSVLVVADEPALSALGAFLAGRPSFPLHVHAQVSLIRILAGDRRPEWFWRPDALAPAPLLLA